MPSNKSLLSMRHGKLLPIGTAVRTVIGRTRYQRVYSPAKEYHMHANLFIPVVVPCCDQAPLIASVIGGLPRGTQARETKGGSAW